jgi:predicted Zn-dependent peptidase
MVPPPSRRFAVWCALLLASGCGGTALHAPPRPLQTFELIRPSDGTRPDLAVIARPGGEFVYLALWIDAGARDAALPQTATLAAWLAEDATGHNARAQVWPDAIELAGTCRKRELAACVARLGRALSLRDVQRAVLADAQSRLADARRTSAARDPERRADELALRALYGEDAAALFPFGRAEDDARAADAGALRAFMGEHFGVRRALLVAIGDVDARAMESAARAGFASVPKTAQPRGERSLVAVPGGSVAVDVDDRAALSLALQARDLDAARAGADALTRRLQRDVPNTTARGHVFAVRGAALALLRVQTREPLAVVHAAAHEVERLRHEDTAVVPAPASGEDTEAFARRLAIRWATRSRAQPSAELGLGIGVLVAGGRADRLAEADPDAALRARFRDRAEEAFASGRALGAPRVDGSIDAHTASVRLDNGVHIELRQRASEQIAVALRFAHGAAAEPPLLHGRAALLATLASTGCAGLPPAQLARRLHELGARLSPRVDAESFGLLLTAPEASWQPALALAVDCALHPTLDRPNLAEARLRLRAQLGSSNGPGALAAASAEWLAPAAPGALAPWGSPDRQASVGLFELRELWSASRAGALLAVAAVGPLPVEQALGVIARRAAELPAGSALGAASIAPPDSVAEPGQPIAQPTFGLVLWRAQMTGADAAGARAFATVARAALGQAPDVAANWYAGGTDAAGGWAAVALSGPTASLSAWIAQLGTVMRSVPATSVARAVDIEFELAQQARADAAADPRTEAEAVARAALGRSETEPNLEAARALARKLAQAEPTWLPLR